MHKKEDFSDDRLLSDLTDGQALSFRDTVEALVQKIIA